MSIDDKARELVEAFFMMVTSKDDVYIDSYWDDAKACALICAKELEILNLELLNHMTGINGGYNVRKETENYYKELREKIQSL